MSFSHLITANIHRVKEGARVLEDIARFTLRDDGLFKEIRNLRHSLKNQVQITIQEQDLGGPSFKENNLRYNLIDITQANITRIQESLRVLEEVSIDSEEKHQFKSLRFDAYKLQVKIQDTVSLYLNYDKLKGLYLVIDTDVINKPIEEITSVINQTSVNIVQFRNKTLSKRAFLEQAIQFKDLLDSKRLFIINDYIDIAIDIGDGVHVGQQDYPITRIKKILPDNFILGVTCHNLSEAKLAVQSGASYISVGCIFKSVSKLDTVPTSIAELIKIKAHSPIPICAIGGINTQNLEEITRHNIDMFAIISGIWTKSNPIKQINALIK